VRFEAVAAEMAEQTFAHLAAGAVSRADEKHAFHGNGK
jgi:hypothetical protein